MRRKSPEGGLIAGEATGCDTPVELPESWMQQLVQESPPGAGGAQNRLTEKDGHRTGGDERSSPTTAAPRSGRQSRCLSMREGEVTSLDAVEREVSPMTPVWRAASSSRDSSVAKRG